MALPDACYLQLFRKREDGDKSPDNSSISDVSTTLKFSRILSERHFFPMAMYSYKHHWHQGSLIRKGN